MRYHISIDNYSKNCASAAFDEDFSKHTRTSEETPEAQEESWAFDVLQLLPVLSRFLIVG